MIDRPGGLAMASVVVAGDQFVTPATPAPEWFSELVRNAVLDWTCSDDDPETGGSVTTVDDGGIARDLWRALADKLADVAPTHRHVKRGTTYRVTSTGGEVQTSRPIVEGDKLTTYVAADGSVWHRLDSEFNDGRFVEIGGKAPFRCGDHVLHRPTGDTLVVAWADPETGRFSWFGWPAGVGLISDCEALFRIDDDGHANCVRLALGNDSDGRWAPIRRLYADVIDGGGDADPA